MNKPDIREQVLQKGMSYPSDEELVMLILGSGTKEIPITKLSKNVITAIESSNAQNRIEALLKVKGIGTTKALVIAAALELGRRKNCHLKAVIKHPKDLVPFIQHYAMQSKEYFLCASLNGAHEIIQIRVVSVGSLNSTIIHPREVFSDAMIEKAAAIIVCHNHPSGNIIPSKEDIKTTQTLISASKILGITLLDHIIFSTENYYSFLEHDLLFNDENNIS